MEKQKQLTAAAAERERELRELFALPKGNGIKDWKIIKVEGRDYLSMRDVAAFYGFTFANRDSNDATLEAATMRLKGEVNSTELSINSIKFMLSYPLVEQDQQLLVSRMDLTKTIDPVLRPNYIKKPAGVETVVLNPAKGGAEEGAKSKLGVEKTYTLDVANRARALLESAGFKVVMTRAGDTAVTLKERVRIANGTPNAILINIHFNAGDKAATGIETFALAPRGVPSMTVEGPRASDLDSSPGNVNDPQNIALATALHASAIVKTRMYDRGIKRARFDVLRDVTIPSVMIVGGFLSYEYDERLVATVGYRQQMAESILMAVQNYRKAVVSAQKSTASPPAIKK